MNIYIAWLKAALVVTVLITSIADAKEINGFPLDDALIPVTQIFSGGPDKDGIASIDHPKFVKGGDAGFMQANDRVIGIVIDGEAKAYPIKILNWHEVVNDTIHDTAFTITYCPLCGTGMAFNSVINGRVLSFGVSGLLYNSDVLLYDRESESLWSQLLNIAVTGKYKGTALKMLPVMHTTWKDWKHFYPSTLVLSENTGYWRSYNRDPYAGYDESSHLYFPVFNKVPKKYHPKEKVLGLAVIDVYKAYPFVELNKNKINRLTDTVNGKVFTIHWNKEERAAYITGEDGSIVPSVQSYWFAWYAFHPETEVFSGE